MLLGLTKELQFLGLTKEPTTTDLTEHRERSQHNVIEGRNRLIPEADNYDRHQWKLSREGFLHKGEK